RRSPRHCPERGDQVGHPGWLLKFHFKFVAAQHLGEAGEGGDGEARHPTPDSSSSSATRMRTSLLGLKTGTGRAARPTGSPGRGDQVGYPGWLLKFHFKFVAAQHLGEAGEGGDGEARHPTPDSSSSSATRMRNSLLGLKTGTGRAATSTGSPVRGLRAMRVFRRRILNVPKPRISMFCCSLSACFTASRSDEH